MATTTVAVRRRPRAQRAAHLPFDSATQTARAWINDIRNRGGGNSRKEAYHALRGVLHALRDRLSVNEAADFGAQLPLLIRGIYYEGWRPAGKPLKERHKSEFVAHVSRELTPGTFDRDVEKITRAVLHVLRERISDGEVADIMANLPGPVRELWE